MPLNLKPLDDEPRLLIEVKLKPVQGSRFQPTGFPDLGAATFRGFNDDGGQVDCLLVESAQSMANRLEAVCWDEATGRLVSTVADLPYVSVLQDGTTITNSILESHRLSSGYILDDKDFIQRLGAELDISEKGRVDIRRLARIILKYDTNSLIHGLFLATKDLAGGRLRLPRMLSSFIESEGYERADSGGVKLDAHDPKGDTSKNLGNVPFHRTEFAARSTTAYFNLDLALLRGYGLGNDAESMLIALSLFKIREFLHSGLRLRTACDLDAGEFQVTRPDGFEIPSRDELKNALPGLIAACRDENLFADPAITEVTYSKGKKKKESK